MRGLTLAVLTLGILSAPLAPCAEQATKVPRIGILSLLPPSNFRFDAFRQGLRDLGYAEGRNVAIEYRSAGGDPDRLPALAIDLVRMRADVIVATGEPAIQAAQRATSTIPIVAIAADLVETGHAASLPRPGGNITGLIEMSPDLSAKRVELLKEMDPKASRVAVLWNSANRVMALNFRETERGARALGLVLQSLAVQDPNDFDSALKTAISERVDALIVLNDLFLVFHVKRIVGLVARSRLPAVYGSSDWARAGGLMSYAASRAELFRHAALYADKILKGAKPGDLPIEQPTKFELVINMRTAKALGLTIPQSLLLRADEIIQ